MPRLVLAIITLFGYAGSVSLVLYLLFRKTLVFKLWLSMVPGISVMVFIVYMVGYLGDGAMGIKLSIATVAIVVMVGNLYLIGKWTTKRLMGNIDNVGTITDVLREVADALSLSSRSLSGVVADQAESLEEVSATLEEMTAMTSESAERSDKAQKLAVEVQEAAVETRSTLEELTRGITRIKGSTDTSTQIVKTIDEIAFKTNILALNAAVEAARAGQAGRGFAVVADEVRNLAKHSAEAAKATNANLEEVQSTVADGVALAVSAATSMERVATLSRSATDEIRTTAEVTRQQALAITEVSRAAARMERVTQAAARTAEENATAALDLADRVAILDGVARELERLTGLVKRARDEALTAARAQSSP